VIDSDDEVAVTFTDYLQYKSEALIDIRYNLFLARKKNIIDNQTKKNILYMAKKTYFPYRTYDNIIDQSMRTFPLNKKQIENFQEYIKKNKKSLKEKDAIKLLLTIKKSIEYTTEK
ncbi:MAG TPA: TfuA-like protein, partial [Candidatus Nitrosocosmicus sp.]